MKKIIILSILLFLIVLAGVSALISRVYPREVQSGKSVEMVVTLFNHDSSTVRGARVTTYIPSLDVFDRSGNIKVRAKKSGRVFLNLDLPKEVKPDYYPVIITIQDDDVREKRHFWVYIS